MAVSASSEVSAVGLNRLRMRRWWLVATIALTVCPFVAAVGLAPAGSAPAGTALVWLLFVGSSVHVASSAWFYSLAEVRAHMRLHLTRYVRVPVGLVIGTATLTSALSPNATTWLLLAFFAWQFFHFQKQNLGIAALACAAGSAGRLTVWERRALIGTGVGGIAALIGHPELLQLHHIGVSLRALFVVGGCLFSISAAVGVTALIRRPVSGRPTAFTIIYLSSLLFFTPVWLFGSPYAAVAGLTIAHGLQYLLLIGLLAAAPTPGRPAALNLMILLNIALILGLALNQASHLHGTSALGKALFGAYLGIVMTHFVIDAGLWRLRDNFPRTFLAQRLPYLLQPASS